MVSKICSYGKGALGNTSAPKDAPAIELLYCLLNDLLTSGFIKEPKAFIEIKTETRHIVNKRPNRSYLTNIIIGRTITKGYRYSA
jgi:hypothetical protein